jgi:hypothetical protein
MNESTSRRGSWFDELTTNGGFPFVLSLSKDELADFYTRSSAP